MSETDDADAVLRLVGERVAAARRQRGLTLAAVTELSGLSPAYLSQIESGMANPTLRTLAQIARSLGTDVGSLLGARDDGPAGSAVSPYFGSGAGAVRDGAPAGVWDRTAAGASQLVARLVRGAPPDHLRPICHSGEEFVIVLTGSCRLQVAGAEYRLRTGDSCHFDARQPHHFSDATAELTLSVVMSEE